MPNKIVRTSLDHDDVERLGEEMAYQGYGRVTLHQLRHRRYDQTWSEPMTRELFDSGDAVVVLPYDPIRDEVVLVEQFRISAFAHGQNPWLIECIAGRYDGNETAQEVAIREAREEANCVIADLITIGDMFISPGIFAEFVTMFCARCDTSSATGVYGLDHEQEDIRVLAVAFDDALAALSDGRINTSPPFICLNWLALHRDELRRRWR